MDRRVRKISKLLPHLSQKEIKAEVEKMDRELLKKLTASKGKTEVPF